MLESVPIVGPLILPVFACLGCAVPTPSSVTYRSKTSIRQIPIAMFSQGKGLTNLKQSHPAALDAGLSQTYHRRNWRQAKRLAVHTCTMYMFLYLDAEMLSLLRMENIHSFIMNCMLGHWLWCALGAHTCNKGHDVVHLFVVYGSDAQQTKFTKMIIPTFSSVQLNYFWGDESLNHQVWWSHWALQEVHCW